MSGRLGVGQLVIGTPPRHLCGSGRFFGGRGAPSSSISLARRESIMSDPQRREFLAAAGIASLAAPGAAQPAAGGDRVS